MGLLEEQHNIPLPHTASTASPREPSTAVRLRPPHYRILKKGSPPQPPSTQGSVEPPRSSEPSHPSLVDNIPRATDSRPPPKASSDSGPGPTGRRPLPRAGACPAGAARAGSGQQRPEAEPGHFQRGAQPAGHYPVRSARPGLRPLPAPRISGSQVSPLRKMGPPEQLGRKARASGGGKTCSVRRCSAHVSPACLMRDAPPPREPSLAWGRSTKRISRSGLKTAEYRSELSGETPKINKKAAVGYSIHCWMWGSEPPNAVRDSVSFCVQTPTSAPRGAPQKC
ncbi:PREDICTED: basic proline-rich protein-like [Chinchilla lanigera]|uniref:basic proline-rich protein-like n=1 Tax=Chinchilla lanigera TaxID=34839 RepID=UPI000697E7A3|nr:PREDICTED: basic proline-rich protein-like [Chinchilla lanigera]